ncbi:MAG TPA: TMEM14 family protein [Verrucomicrobiae bacterium]
MNDYDVKILWVYIVLLLVGGLIGFLKAKSKVSLVSSAVFAALLILTALRGVFQPGFALGLANVTLVVLLLVFAVRLAKTKKFMPSGLILAATVVVLALLNLKFR